MIRILGAAMLVGGCCGFGCILARNHHREVRQVRQLRKAVQEMQWELKFRMTALPELCMLAGQAAGEPLKHLFFNFSKQLDSREVTDLSACFNGMLMNEDLTRRVKALLRQLGDCLGRFDLEGQLQGLEEVRQQCVHELKELEEKTPDRLKNYRTLAVSAGVVLAILFL